MAWGVPTVKTTVRGAKGVWRDDTGWNCLRTGHFPVMVSFTTGPEVHPPGYDRGNAGAREWTIRTGSREGSGSGRIRFHCPPVEPATRGMTSQFPSLDGTAFSGLHQRQPPPQGKPPNSSRNRYREEEELKR